LIDTTPENLGILFSSSILSQYNIIMSVLDLVDCVLLSPKFVNSLKEEELSKILKSALEEVSVISLKDDNKVWTYIYIFFYLYYWFIIIVAILTYIKGSCEIDIKICIKFNY
jgi:hypothetical protein